MGRLHLHGSFGTILRSLDVSHCNLCTWLQDTLLASTTDHRDCNLQGTCLSLGLHLGTLKLEKGG